jgi:hypothetical protein
MKPLREFLVIAGLTVVLSLLCGFVSPYVSTAPELPGVFFRLAKLIAGASLVFAAAAFNFVIWQDSRRGGAGPVPPGTERGALPRKSPRRE